MTEAIQVGTGRTDRMCGELGTGERGCFKPGEGKMYLAGPLNRSPVQAEKAPWSRQPCLPAVWLCCRRTETLSTDGGSRTGGPTRYDV